MSKTAKFQSDLLKTNKDIASQSRKISQTSVQGGTNCPPPPHPTLQKLTTYHLEIGNFTNLN